MSQLAPSPKKAFEILLVEDHPGDARLIQEMLRDLPAPGCVVTCLPRLADAQAYLQTAHPEVILMDLGLPDARGLEALEGVRRLASAIPVVVLTGMDDQRVAHQALGQGAQDYLVKGRIDPEILLRSMRYAMDRQRREAAHRANLVSAFLHCVVGDPGPGEPAWASLPPFSTAGNPLPSGAPEASEGEGRFARWFSADMAKGRDEPPASQDRETRLQQVADQLQTLSRQLVDVQEHERYTLSRELHDRVGQNLTALALDLDLLGRHLLDGDLAALAARLKECHRLVRTTSEVVSNVMAELRPQMLDDYGLAPAIEWYAAEWTQRTGIPVSVRRSHALGRLPSAYEIGLFRILQEALTNIAKHAEAAQVWVLLARSGSRLRMIIADDGRGIDRSPGHTRLGHGMLIMRERAKSLQGRFYAMPRAAGGTFVIVELREAP